MPQNTTKGQLMKLISDKEKLESKIRDNGLILEMNANIGMTGSLVDADGFPRNDIDVYQVRQARQQIICLQNDYKDLMKQIEKMLHLYHEETAGAAADTDLTNRTTAMELNEDSSSANVALHVIAKINMVSPNSPAELAGLRVDDEILVFGSINSQNFTNDLNQIGTVVRHMQDQRITLQIKRNGQTLELILIPKTWSGRGLLGCNIVLPNAVGQ